MTSSPLVARLTQAPPLANARQAKSRIADLVERAEREPEAAALLPLLGEGAFRDLVAGLADHSPFLWHLAYQDPVR
jgi:glutamate-ammonia-ligase adenylyltransferase